MEKEEKLLLAQAEDKARQRNNRNILTHTGFLSMAEQALLEHVHPDGTFYGGYEDAERCMLVFLPDWLPEIPAEDGPVCVLRVTLPKGSSKLTHRDYLGSLLALGVERSVIGDILVQEDGADILVSADMADYLVQNYVQAGRTSLSCTILPLSALRPGVFTVETRRDTVASLRLDSVLASMFSMSRGKAQEAIHMGLAAVNNRIVDKPDHFLSEGDKVSLRGKGKAILKEVGGKSRKDRDCIVFERYL